MFVRGWKWQSGIKDGPLHVRPIMDYDDIIYGKSNNESFKNKIESMQHKACLTTTGAI